MGYGQAESSFGSRGMGGSAGAFMGGGLQTGTKWNGTKAHFNGGQLQGFSNGQPGGGYSRGFGQAESSYGASGLGGSNYGPMGMLNQPPQQQQPRQNMPSPGGYADPVLQQPLPPVQPPVPAAAPPPGEVVEPWESAPPNFNKYDALRSGIPPGTMKFGPFKPAGGQAARLVPSSFNPPQSPYTNISMMGRAIGPASYNRTTGNVGPSPSSFYGNPRLGTPNLGSMMSGYNNQSGGQSGDGFHGGGGRGW